MFTTQNLTLFLAVLLSALIAGLFYGYSCSVNPGLGRLADVEYLKAMQSINRAILNPVFFMSFMGTLIVLPICTWLKYTEPPSSGFYFLLSASVLYGIGVFGVTMIGNVPLNEMLDAFDIRSSTASEVSTHRERFERLWNTYHQIRTVSSITVLALVILSILKK